MLRRALEPAELVPFALAAVAVLLTVELTASNGVTLGLGPLVACALFVGAVACFLVAPHAAFAAAVPIFALIPITKVFVTPWVGPAKDAIVLAAIVATLLHVLDRGGRAAAAHTDPAILLGVLSLLGLYVLNVGGGTSGNGYGGGWIQGMRLVAEPLCLLVAGLLLPGPYRTLRWIVRSLVVTSVLVGFYGLVQQVLGPDRLVSLGYSYSAQVFKAHGYLRSFGTLDDSFAYAALLMLGLAASIFALRGGRAVAAGLFIALAAAAAIVQTSVLVLAVLVAVALARSRKPVAAVLVIAVIGCVAMALALGSANVTEQHTVNAGADTFLTLNGRTSVWSSIFADPNRLPLGLGVGVVGTAAARAQVGVTSVAAKPHAKGVQSVDSGYFATVADVGFLGLGMLLFLLTRLVLAARRAVRGPLPDVGWLALACLGVMMIDALTRDSFTGFPNAYLGLLLVGLCLGAARDAELDRAGAAR